MLHKSMIYAVLMLCNYTAYAKFNNTITNIVNALSEARNTVGSIDYVVSLPSSIEHVNYKIEYETYNNPSDTLLSYSYLIEWQNSGNNGFSAYFNGHHYRFRDIKLQEYHFQNQPELFIGKYAVQNQAQFANILPPSIGKYLSDMQADSSYTYDVNTANDIITVSGVENVRGHAAALFEYAFDSKTLMPLTANITYNPASISEQTVTAYFQNVQTPQSILLDEDMLISKYPDVFDKFRTSNFRVENLVGKRTPAFSAMTKDHKRYNFDGDTLRGVPTLMVFVDSEIGATRDVIKEIRKSMTLSPQDFNVIYAFKDADAECFVTNFNQVLTNETILVSTKAMARDFGVTATPTLIFCTRNNIIHDVIVGVNKNIASIVIQEMALCDNEAKSEKIDYIKRENHTTKMETVYFKGTPCHTYGKIPAVGEKAPCYNFVNTEMKEIQCYDFQDKRVVLNIFPSIDTPVCAASVRRFNLEAANLDNTVVICVSMDLPFAGQRFCAANNINNVIVASAFRSLTFAQKYGLQLVDGTLAGLLARAIIILDEHRQVLYTQLVHELTDEPDYAEALQALTK